MHEPEHRSAKYGILRSVLDAAACWQQHSEAPQDGVGHGMAMGMTRRSGESKTSWMYTGGEPDDPDDGD
eukprot:4155644-Pleurochrysis_carterae.AAC.1